MHLPPICTDQVKSASKSSVVSERRRRDPWFGKERKERDVSIQEVKQLLRSKKRLSSPHEMALIAEVETCHINQPSKTNRNYNKNKLIPLSTISIYDHDVIDQSISLQFIQQIHTIMVLYNFMLEC
jgi:hypothetical protein